MGSTTVTVPTETLGKLTYASIPAINFHRRKDRDATADVIKKSIKEVRSEIIGSGESHIDVDKYTLSHLTCAGWKGKDNVSEFYKHHDLAKEILIEEGVWSR